MRYLLAIPLILAPTLASAQTCPGFSPSGATTIPDADRFYGERAATIVRAAMTRDRAALNKLVADDASVRVWMGDVEWSPASYPRTAPPVRGADALIALADRLKPRDYTLVLDDPGPLAVANPDRCVRGVTLLIEMTESGQAASLEFSFRDGKLKSVGGSQKGVVEGRFP
jgi:hypothetical protein